MRHFHEFFHEHVTLCYRQNIVIRDLVIIDNVVHKASCQVADEIADIVQQ